MATKNYIAVKCVIFALHFSVSGGYYSRYDNLWGFLHLDVLQPFRGNMFSYSCVQHRCLSLSASADANLWKRAWFYRNMLPFLTWNYLRVHRNNAVLLRRIWNLLLVFCAIRFGHGCRNSNDCRFSANYLKIIMNMLNIIQTNVYISIDN